ncbi:hypothetical protein EVA_15344 [gut metagenome]|uniref:Uncharacterized protein n=1 Tax=gut metagenome TaxID=749906 RepID=J9GAY1_9ZZZZ
MPPPVVIRIMPSSAFIRKASSVRSLLIPPKIMSPL